MTTGIRAGASASGTRLALIAETAWGTTPATPAFQNIRFTSESLQPAKNTVRSNEVRADRNVVDEIQVGRSVAGALDFELSYETFDDLLEALMFSTWGGAESAFLKNGIGVGTSFTAERTILLPGGTSEYHRFVGLVPDTMSLSVQAAGIITGSFGMMGKFGSRATTAIAGSTYTAATDDRVLNAANHFASLAVSSLSPVPIIRSLTLDITNNIREQQAVGSLDTAGLAPGRFEVTGSFEAYFSSGTLLQSFLDHDDLSLSFVLGTEAGSRYEFTLPTIVMTGSPGANATGNDADIMQTVAFTAVLDRLSDPLLGCTIQIERDV